MIQRGGIAIFPVDVGYSIMGGSADALRKIFATKQRAGHKRNGLIADMVTQREVHDLPRERQDMIELITQDYNLPLGPIAPFRPDHPLIRKVDPDLLRASSAGGTLAMLVNAGPFHAEVCRLSREAVHPMLGSSANLTGTGTRFRLEDIQPELRAIADIEIDYGLRKYHWYGRSSTMINFETMQVVRIGACYDQICDILKRHYDIDLPEDPGLAANPNGHTNEFALPVI
ncbi:MAG TPA: Sua5/YciO/YrdC/YwlC family protein [Paraburkholderia sp.]|nr:Sua5/YciO/YrdC/YwlC family protein [Paraburkholderia sp.]